MNLTRKLWCVCEYYTYQTTALLLGNFCFWDRVVYNLQLASYGLETVSKDASHARSLTSWASVYAFRVWHVSQATPEILIAWNCE